MELYDKKANNGNLVNSSGVSSLKSFSIAESSHMFRILSDGLYQDKIGAVIQEICCNATDAHIMSGIPDRPIEVKLPSRLDRQFYIKDFGTGLSDDDIQGLYTTYGASTKQQSKDTTGAFGLGSKSPFAYTGANEDTSDGFTVVSIFEGVKRIYTAFILESGEPGIAKTYEGPNDEEDWKSGIMVSFPVQEKDINEFHTKAVQKLRWFKVPPVILGLSSTLPAFTEGYSVVKDMIMLTNSYSSYARSVAVMGGVAYPIDISKLNHAQFTMSDKDEELVSFTSLELSLLYKNAALLIPLGDILMTPSREALQYVNRTFRGLKKCLSAAVLSIANEIKQKAIDEDYDSHWERLKKCHEFTSTMGSDIAGRLEDYLVVAGVDADLAKSLAEEINQKSIKFPSWVGFGSISAGLEDELEAASEAEKEAIKKTIADAAAGVIADVEEDAEDESDVTKSSVSNFIRDRAIKGLKSECRVWTYGFSDSRDGVARREVVGGVYPSNSSQVQPAFLAVDSEYVIVVADSKSVDEKVRSLVKNSNNKKFKAILIAPLSKKEGALDIVNAYVDKLQKEKGFDGIEVVNASDIDISDIVAARKANRALIKSATPSLAYGKEFVRYFDVASGSFKEGTVADFTDPSDYWMLNPDSSYTAKTYTYRISYKLNIPAISALNKGNSNWTFQINYFTDTLAKIVALYNLVSGENVTKVMLLPNDSKLKRWKLEDTGFKFLDKSLNDVLVATPDIISSKVVVDEIKEWETAPSNWRMGEYCGLLGYLIHALDGFNSGNGSYVSIWSNLFSKFGTHPIMTKALEMVSEYEESKNKADKPLDLTDISSVVSSLSKGNNPINFELTKSNVINDATLLDMSDQLCPEAKLFEWHRLDRGESDKIMLAANLVLNELPTLRSSAANSILQDTSNDVPVKLKKIA